MKHSFLSLAILLSSACAFAAEVAEDARFSAVESRIKDSATGIKEMCTTFEAIQAELFNPDSTDEDALSACEKLVSALRSEKSSAMATHELNLGGKVLQVNLVDMLICGTHFLEAFHEAAKQNESVAAEDCQKLAVAAERMRRSIAFLTDAGMSSNFEEAFLQEHYLAVLQAVSAVAKSA